MEECQPGKEVVDYDSEVEGVKAIDKYTSSIQTKQRIPSISLLIGNAIHICCCKGSGRTLRKRIS